MTRASATRIARRRRGRPKGSAVPLERDRQKHEIAIWHGICLFAPRQRGRSPDRRTRQHPSPSPAARGLRRGIGPYDSAQWAVWVTSDAPIKPEDVEGLLTAAGTEIKFTASKLENHIDRLARKAKSIPVDSNPWLHVSALAIKGLIHAYRIRNMEVFCDMVDILIGLGWRDVIQRLTARIEDLAKSNVPPHEGKLGREGQALLNWLRARTGKKTK